MKARKLLSTLATAGLILFAGSLFSACAESFVAESPGSASEQTELVSAKVIERYGPALINSPRDEATATGSSSASDSTSTN